MISKAVPMSHRRILIVDDDHDSAAMLALLLDSYGHTVAQAYNGSAALKRASEFLPEIVFLDLLMPGMDGFAVLQDLREQERLTTSRAIIIALSACGDSAYREATSEEGFDGHLQKPFDADELMLILPSLDLGPVSTADIRPTGNVGRAG